MAKGLKNTGSKKVNKRPPPSAFNNQLSYERELTIAKLYTKYGYIKDLQERWRRDNFALQFKIEL